MSSIEDLKAQLIKRSGPAHQNRFKLVATLPPAVRSISNGEDLSILCENCILPGRQINTFDYQLLRQSIKVPNGYINEDVSFTFLLTNDYYVKKIFDLWASSTINFSNYRAKYLENYAGTFEIWQLDKDDKQIYGVRLTNAFPISLTAITLDNNAENTLQKFTVTVAYEDFATI
jgi:hypothetical protein